MVTEPVAKPPEPPDPNAFIPKAPSQMVNAQGPAAKPGEPLGVTMRTDPTVGKEKPTPPPPPEPKPTPRAATVKK